jgi:uncharacterized membrane protein
MLIGAVTGAVLSLFTLPAAAVLLGWDAAAAVYLAWAWGAVWNMDPGTTARFAGREDPSSAAAEFLVVAAGTSMLTAVGFALVRVGTATGGHKVYLIALGGLSVALSWAVVHTAFTLRYAAPTTLGLSAGSASMTMSPRVHGFRLFLLHYRDDLPGFRHRYHSKRVRRILRASPARDVTLR